MKVLYIHANETDKGGWEDIHVESYDYHKHGGMDLKFVYWCREEILLLCPDWIEHKKITDLGVISREISSDTTPDGVGLMWDGSVRDWESVGYQLNTPPELRSVICDALGLSDKSWD